MKPGPAALAALFLSALALVFLVAPGLAEAKSFSNCGRASWYALTSQTASGEMMDASQLTAAHRTLPFGTRIQVTNVNNGRSVIVRINDRGPFAGGRVLDLSKAAAKQLEFISRGVTKVCMTTTLNVPAPRPRPLKDDRPLKLFHPARGEAGQVLSWR